MYESKEGEINTEDSIEEANTSPPSAGRDLAGLSFRGILQFPVPALM